MSDITIDGDVKAQQGIRFNISIEPNVFRKRFSIKYWTKGFTGENMADLPIGIPPIDSVLHGNQRPRSSSKLLTYRYNQLDKAIENAAKLGFTNALLYTQWLL
jgi:maltose phosphorylase